MRGELPTRRILSITVGLLVLLSATGSLVALGAVGPAAGAPAGPFAQPECIIDGELSATPRGLLLGETVTGSLRLWVWCPPPGIPMHVVMVIDSSTRIDRSEQREIGKVAAQLAETVFGSATDTRPVRVGVVRFDTRARTVCHLTDDKERVRRCLRSLRREEGSRLDVGVEEGLRALARARRLATEDGAAISEIMILFSQGESETGCTPALKARQKVMGQGVLLATVCVGLHCNARCMRQLASPLHYFYRLADVSELMWILGSVPDVFRFIPLQPLVVTYTLSADMRYVPGSADPAPKAISPDGDVLTWQTNYVPIEGVTYTFRVQPQEPGWRPLGGAARVWFQTLGKRRGPFSLSLPARVTVLQPVDLPRPPKQAGNPSASRGGVLPSQLPLRSKRVGY